VESVERHQDLALRGVNGDEPSVAVGDRREVVRGSPESPDPGDAVGRGGDGANRAHRHEETVTEGDRRPLPVEDRVAGLVGRPRRPGQCRPRNAVGGDHLVGDDVGRRQGDVTAGAVRRGLPRAHRCRLLGPGGAVARDGDHAGVAEGDPPTVEEVDRGPAARRGRGLRQRPRCDRRRRRVRQGKGHEGRGDGERHQSPESHCRQSVHARPCHQGSNPDRSDAHVALHFIKTFPIRPAARSHETSPKSLILTVLAHFAGRQTPPGPRRTKPRWS
jgi:hypothetical protein